MAKYGRKSDPHEKSMESYQQAAWADAISMAELLAGSFADEVGLSIGEIRRQYEQIPIDELKQFEGTYSHLIGEYLAKTDRQRPASFRKITAQVDTVEKIMFLVMCLRAAIRASDLLVLRDRYRMVLAPGWGNRVTVAGAYRFSIETQRLMNYAWPFEAFEALGIDDDDNDD